MKRVAFTSPSMAMGFLIVRKYSFIPNTRTQADRAILIVGAPVDAAHTSADSLPDRKHVLGGFLGEGADERHR